MKIVTGLVTLAVTNFALARAAVAQVAFPQSPAELVAMASANEYSTNLQHRAFVQKSMEYALTREASASSKPYTNAIQAWLVNMLNSDGRELHMFGEQLAAGTVTAPIDLYLLAGQSNMVGLTESGGAY